MRGIVIFVASLEVLIEAERSAVLDLLVSVVLLGAGHDTGLLVVTNTLLEEVGLAGQRDVVHEVEWVGHVVVLLVAKSHEKSVSDELDVLAHELGVHSKQVDGESLRQELLLDRDSVGDDVLHDLLAGAVVEVGEQQASEVGVQTLITRDQLVGEGETWHQTTLLQPEDGSKGAREEDALHSGEGNKTLSESGLLVLDPFDGPLSLLADARNCDALALSLLKDSCI